MLSKQTIYNQLRNITDKINQKQFFDADRQLNAYINTNPLNAELWHLKSVTTQALGRLIDCEFALNKTLELSPNHLHALSNFAKLQQTNNWFDDAIVTYGKILKLSPKNLQALFNIGILLNKVNKHTQAENHLQQALSLNNQNINIILAYGQSLLNQDKNSEALVLFNRILTIDPNHIAALNNKGITLKKMCHWNDAIFCLRHALSISSEQIEVIKNLASCYTLTGDFEQSKSLYTKAISINDLDMDAHHWLNQQLWENKDKSFLESYKQAIKKHPKESQLLFDMGHKLHLSRDFLAAKDTLEKGLKINKNHSPSLLELGRVLRELNQLEKSQEVIKKAYRINQSNISTNEELAISYICCNEPKKALALFDDLIKKSPLQQSLYSYKAIALKLLGSSEYDYLCNYDHLLITEISVPNGYASLSDFNKSLVEALREYHFAKTNPLDQSLINGSQTSEKLFDYHIPIIQELRECFREKTIDFLANLPKDINHPLLSKNTGDFVETDSWSVILHNTGFHKNHFHPSGWYSGPYYAQIPNIIKNNPNKEGWVKFGQPGFNMMTQLEPDLIVEPKEGMMVRFPSYFWHGTIPFTSSQERITVPGDIIPR